MPSAANRPRVGISRCLLGDEVRYDGGHKREPDLVEALGRAVDWVSVCPEVEVGMGVPREPIQLVVRVDDDVRLESDRVRLVGVASGEDWTDRMDAWARQRVRQLASMELSGYILKARSPSCGPGDVPIHGAPDAGSSEPRGRGRFAQALITAWPELPLEDEERLRDPVVRRTFLDRVVAYWSRCRRL